MSTSRASRSLPPFKKRWCSYSGASSEKVKKARLSAVAYLNQRQSGQDQSHGAASSAEQPVAANVTTAEGASSSADSSSGHGQAAATGGQQYRNILTDRNRKLIKTGAAIPAGTRKACAMPIGKEMDNELMDPRLCRAAFRDQLVRAIRYGVMKLLTAYETQTLRKPPGSEFGPAREGAVIERPSACEAGETSKDVSSAIQATDAGHHCYHIVFQALLAVADMVRELQKEGIAGDVEVDVPETYRYYNECTAEDTVEAALTAGGSTWNTPGQVRPKADRRDAVGLAADHLGQLIAKTQDCIKRCWPEGVQRSVQPSEVRRVADSFMEIFYIPKRPGKKFQSNMKDFVRNYFVFSPKTTSFMQLKKTLRQVEGLQTATGRAEQRRRTILQQALDRSGVWECSDVENAD